MKKVRMNISHSRFILSKLKIFGEIVTTILLTTISSNLKTNITTILDKKVGMSNFKLLLTLKQGKKCCIISV